MGKFYLAFAIHLTVVAAVATLGEFADYYQYQCGASLQ